MKKLLFSMTIIFGLYTAQGQIINPKDKIKDKTTNKTNQIKPIKKLTKALMPVLMLLKTV